MKPSLCIPRLRTNAATCGQKKRGASQISMLDRLREAMLHFIMLSALSKASSTQSADSNTADEYSGARDNCYHPPEPHHNEAVADCIEFIKKSTTIEDGRDPTAISSSSAHDVIFRVPATR